MADAITRDVDIVRDEVVLKATVCVPNVGERDGSKRAAFPVAVLAHGIMAHRNVYRFECLASQLADIGIASVRVDMSGRGESGGKFEDMTVLTDIADLEAVFSFVCDEPGLDEERVAFVGHSQGAVDVALFAAKHPHDTACAVLLSPATVLQDDCRSRNNPFPVGEEYLRVGSCLDIYGKAGSYKGPVCIVSGARDEMVPVECVQRLADVYSDVDLHVFSHDDHSLMQCFEAVQAIVVDFVSSNLLPQRAYEKARAVFVDMLRRMQAQGRLGRLDDPDTSIPPRILDGIKRFEVYQADVDER